MWKTLLKHLGKYRTSSFLSAISIMCEVIIEVQIPYFMAQIIDKGIPSGHIGQIVVPAVILVACALASMGCGLLSGQFAAHAGTGFAANLRRAVFEKVQTFSFTNIDRFSSSGLITRLTTDITNVQTAWLLLIRQIVRSPFMIILCFVQAYRINPQMSIINIISIILLSAGFAALMVGTRPIFRRALKMYDKLNRIVQENIRGIRVVKSFVRERQETKKFDDTSAGIYTSYVKAEKLFSLTNPFLQLMFYGTLISIAYFSARLIVVDGTMTTGELTSLIMYNMLILNAILMTSMSLLQVVNGGASGRRIADVLAEESTITNPAQAAIDVTDGSVEFHNVTFHYNEQSETPSLANVDLHIESGQTIGVVGDTGSSKSTLVQLIPRLYDANVGEVRVGGRDVREYDLQALRDKVAIVLQKNVLFSGTIMDNLRWGNPDATRDDCIRACRLAQADEFISCLPDGYNSRVAQGGANFSGGQRQRLCIARALLKDPKILILDDSTSAVDMATEARLRQAFAEYLPDVTKFIIAQRVNSVKDSDAIIVMHKGQINGFGTHEQLYAANDIYRQVYDTQNPAEKDERDAAAGASGEKPGGGVRPDACLRPTAPSGIALEGGVA
ncbi:MAG: ABC transporter ATP-binding protein/permease [Actinomycetes bacterium]|jgi:ATP-binding cassette subfamily B protein|nr:ABC transporter ATP-binding protein/permease [Actinomycetes bacterium]